MLDTLAIEKRREIAGEVQAEGWKWAEAHIDYPHAHGMRRFYPERIALSDEDEARLTEASANYDQLVEGYDSFEEMPEDVAAKVEALDAEIDALSARQSAYDPQVIANGGAFVVLNHDGTVKIERGLFRLEDEALADPQTAPDAEGEAAFDGVQAQYRAVVLVDVPPVQAMPDSVSDVPQYLMLRDQVAQEIETGWLAPGPPLPSERRLQTDAGAARGTIRAAALVGRMW